MADLPITSYSLESKDNFMVGAGALVTGLSYDKQGKGYKYEEMLGATTGGTQVNLNTTLRQMEIDGLFATPVGADQIEEAIASMEVNLLEATLKNLKLALIADERTATAQPYMKDGTKYIRPVGRIRNDHYLEGLALLVPISDGRIMVIRFDYAIATDGLEFNPQDGEDNTFSVTLEARTNPSNLTDASLPVTIFFVDKEEDDDDNPSL